MSKFIPTEEPGGDKFGTYIVNSLSIILIFTLLVMDSNSSIPIIAGVALSAVTVTGLGWLLFKRCKFTTGQLLLALLLSAVETTLLLRFASLNLAAPSDLLILACAPLLSFVGLFLGARYAGDPTVQSPSSYRTRFLFGLLIPVVFPALIIGLFTLALYVQRRL